MSRGGQGNFAETRTNTRIQHNKNSEYSVKSGDTARYLAEIVSAIVILDSGSEQTWWLIGIWQRLFRGRRFESYCAHLPWTCPQFGALLQIVSRGQVVKWPLPKTSSTLEIR